MRSLAFLAAALVLIPTVAEARDVQVKGHIRKDGTYVPPHTRTTPDSSPYNNWTTKPNYNPYTGEQGTVDPYKAPSVPQWQPYKPQSQPQPKTPGTVRCAYGATVC